MTRLWDIYDVEIMVERLVGGIPANERMMQAWLEAKAARMKAPMPIMRKLVEANVATTVEAAAAEHVAMREELDPEDTHAVVFFRAPDKANLFPGSARWPEEELERWLAQSRPCYEGRNFKAALKEGANILGTTSKRTGILEVANFRSKLAERVFVMPKYVPILAEVKRDERPISVMTMQGPRTSIKRFEYVEDVRLSFTLEVLRDGMVLGEHLEQILTYLQRGGIGADRSQGSGTFELLKFVKQED